MDSRAIYRVLQIYNSLANGLLSITVTVTRKRNSPTKSLISRDVVQLLGFLCKMLEKTTAKFEISYFSAITRGDQPPELPMTTPLFIRNYLFGVNLVFGVSLVSIEIKKRLYANFHSLK